MNTSESIRALRRANPRSKPGFAATVETSATGVRALISTDRVPRVRRQQPIARVSLAGTLLVAAASVIALLAVDLSGRTPAVEDAVAAINQAAAVSAASAEQSGTAVIRMTNDGELLSANTIEWNGKDLALTNDVPDREGRVGSKFLLVGGMMYGIDAEDGGWVELGPPESIDPDSGTTPAEYLAAVREDVGGATLRRITGGMNGLTTEAGEDGSTVYRGSVAAGLVARETGFKEGQSIRVLPFGYVAHDRAAHPNALLDAAITVGSDGIVRQIAVTWPGWTYTVTYSDLGATPAPTAPDNAEPLRR